MKSPPSKIELLPANGRERLPRRFAPLLSRLVAERIAQFLAKRDDWLIEPFMRERRLADEIRRLQSIPEQEKFSLYFEEFGCLDCKRTDMPHAGNALCHSCRMRFLGRLKGKVQQAEDDIRERGRIERLHTNPTPCMGEGK